MGVSACVVCAALTWTCAGRLESLSVAFGHKDSETVCVRVSSVVGVYALNAFMCYVVVLLLVTFSVRQCESRCARVFLRVVECAHIPA